MLLFSFLLQFQFQEVQLKDRFFDWCNWRSYVSIPRGAVKSITACYQSAMLAAFQFQEVQLKVSSRIIEKRLNTSFNSKRCS